MRLLLVYAILFLLFLGTFLWAKKHNKHDYIDISWGIGFVVTAVLSYILSDNKSLVGQILTILVIFGD